MSPCLLLTALNPISGGHTFLPEDVGVPGQHRLQQHRHVAFRVIAAQVVLQLSATKSHMERVEQFIRSNSRKVISS